MRQYLCDRCGKVAEGDVWKVEASKEAIANPPETFPIDRVSFDLCDDCMAELFGDALE